MTGRVAGKVALITGAGTGIGRACLKLFAEEGASVVGIGRTQATLDESLAEVTAAGGQGMVIAADLSKEADVQRLVEQTVARYGRIDILVHAAGVGWSWGEKSPGSMNDVTTTTKEKWDEVLGINLDSCFFLCRAVVPVMQKQGRGSVVNVSSISGMRGMPTAHTYTASKGAIISMTKAMAATYAKDGIRTNCVAPGYTDTPMIQSVMGVFDDPQLAEHITPMKRAGTPREMAYGCLFLASDEASYCNGVILPIDGGTTARQ